MEITLRELAKMHSCLPGLRRARKAGFKEDDVITLQDVLDHGIPGDAVHFVSCLPNSPFKFRVMGEFIQACVDEGLVEDFWTDYAVSLTRGEIPATDKPFPDEMGHKLKDWTRPMEAIQEFMETQNGRI